MRVFDLVERSEPAAPAPGAEDARSYATKDELSTVAGAVKSALSDIEQMKSDLYGVAGKRRSTKKPEAVDDDE